MSMLNFELAQALHTERLREAEAHRRGRAMRPTRSASKTPEPAVRRSPGLLARVIPWFGARVRTA
jgi:hypothetical protein